MGDTLPCLHCSTETLRVRHFMPGQCPAERIAGGLDLEGAKRFVEKNNWVPKAYFLSLVAEVERLRSLPLSEAPAPKVTPKEIGEAVKWLDELIVLADTDRHSIEASDIQRARHGLVRLELMIPAAPHQGQEGAT